MRAHVIDRIYDQSVGYWQSDLTGIDQLSSRDYGAVLNRYLGVDEARLETIVTRMAANGDLTAASRLVDWYSAFDPGNARVKAVRTEIYRRLAASYQEIDPFRFFIYTERAGLSLTQLEQE
jgi:hypothetical protein